MHVVDINVSKYTLSILKGMYVPGLGELWVGSIIYFIKKRCVTLNTDIGVFLLSLVVSESVSTIHFSLWS